jgi:Flp pilus assembly protein TadG
MAAVRRGARRFRANQSGAAAVEFGLVALPFLMMSFFIINIGMYYFTVNSIDKGVSDATRQILTGNAQTTNMTVGAFRTMVCTQANMGGSYIDCSKLNIMITSSSVSWADLINKSGAQSCTTNGNLNGSTGNVGDLLSQYTGSTSAFVFVLACYNWSGSQILPYWTLATLADGSTVIQSASAFQTEPYS